MRPFIAGSYRAIEGGETHQHASGAESDGFENIGASPYTAVEQYRHAALLGHGISMHPQYMVARDISEKALRVVLPNFQPIGLDICAVYPSRHNMPGRVRLFFEFLRERFQAAGELSDGH